MVEPQIHLLIENMKNVIRLNPNRKIEWLVVSKIDVLKKFDNIFKKQTFAHLINVSNLELMDVAIKYRGRLNWIRYKPSYEHAAGLDLAMAHISPKKSHTFIIDPDFFILMPEWLSRIKGIHLSEFKKMKFLGTSWDCSALKDSIFVPAPHFVSIKLPLDKKFSFNPKLTKRRMIIDGNVSTFLLTKNSKQNNETGYRMINSAVFRRKYHYLWLKWLLFKLRNKISDRSIPSDYWREFTTYRNNLGILFEHVYTSRMAKVKRVLQKKKMRWFLPSLAHRIIAIENSLEVSTKEQISTAFHSGIEYLSLNREIVAFHLRSQGPNKDWRDHEVKKILDRNKTQ